MELAHGTMARLRLPRRTLRFRLTLLYGGVFVALLAIVLFITLLLLRAGFAARPGPPGIAIVDSRHVEAGFALALAVSVLLALTLGWLIAGRLLQPLRTITATAREISATNLHERLDLTGPHDELTELGDTLDGLFGRLEASFESQRRFVANASHELRTPLTAERTLLQVVLADPDTTEETLRSTCKEVLALGERQEHLIEALLTLASSERGIEHSETFDLAEIAEHVLLVRRDEATSQGVDLEATLNAAPISGDPDLVESLISNLVDNALRYNVTQGRVDVVTDLRAGRAVLSVANTGPMVSPAEVERLFEPFRRAGVARTRSNGGHGLGLSIVRAVATAHGATVTADPQEQGGLRVGVSFASSPAIG